METNFQSSLRDGGSFGPNPWAEAHGYRHILALRGGTEGPFRFTEHREDQIEDYD